jgi:hypothetical protein
MGVSPPGVLPVPSGIRFSGLGGRASTGVGRGFKSAWLQVPSATVQGAVHKRSRVSEALMDWDARPLLGIPSECGWGPASDIAGPITPTSGQLRTFLSCFWARLHDSMWKQLPTARMQTAPQQLPTGWKHSATASGIAKLAFRRSERAHNSFQQHRNSSQEHRNSLRQHCNPRSSHKV